MPTALVVVAVQSGRNETQNGQWKQIEHGRGDKRSESYL